MTQNKKNELYDEMCRLLTDYENPDKTDFVPNDKDFYKFLVKLQNSWESL